MRPLLGLSSVGFLFAAAVAQEPDPPPDTAPGTVRVRIVGHADGLPRPGVLLHCAPMVDHRPEVSRDGFVIVEDPIVRQLRAATTVRTDPAGEVELPAAFRRGATQVFVGEPFSLMGEPEEKDGVLVWRAFEREPVGVRVVGGDGRPVAGLPVTLHSGGRDLSFALTDREGRAVLGMPTGHTARVCLAPAGWVGSYDTMPTIATMLAGKRGAELVLPPYGRLRFRALRGGQPLRAAVGVLHLRDPDPEQYLRLAHWAPNGQVDAVGFELPRVAVGLRFAAEIDLLRRHRIEDTGPPSAGHLRTIDLVAPWQPEVRGTCVLPEGNAPPARATLHLRFVTDLETVAATVAIGRDGGLGLGKVGLRGARLLRVHCDVPATDAAAPRAWSATLQPDFDLSQASLELGAIALRATSPPHGRLLFADGQPAKGAWVVATPLPDGHQELLHLDADGRFCWQEALPRDAKGEPRTIRLVGRRGTDVCAPVEFTPGSAAVELRLPSATPPPATGPARPARFQGTLVVTIADPEREPFAFANLSLQGENGIPVEPASRTPAENGAAIVTFRGIQQGRHALCARDQQHITRVILAGLDVPGDGPCTDARLSRVVLGEGLRVLTVRVVDAQGVPMADAFVRSPGLSRQTDGGGTIRIATQDPQPFGARFSARGHRDLEVPALTDGMVVTMPKAGTLRVRLLGLPKDVPRERLQVWVRHEVRERLEGPRGKVDANGIAEVATPVAGNYLLWLLVSVPGPGGEPSSSGVAIRPDPIAIGVDPPPQVDWELDAATLERLQQELSSKR
ncbi:MAG: hypothetical protein IPK26_25070 [Planctomycetes bacterium]|nr:hypothetical protein [Planctomycetota bacterium]